MDLSIGMRVSVSGGSFNETLMGLRLWSCRNYYYLFITWQVTGDPSLNLNVKRLSAFILHGKYS